MNPAIDELLRHPGVWRAQQGPDGLPSCTCVSSGNPALDAWLPNGGWPRGALTELLCEQRGIGEFELLLPLLASLTNDGGRAAMVAPPLLPYAPALSAAGTSLEHLLMVRPRLPAEALWATEQLLRSGIFGVVVLWSTDEVPATSLRRLQLAAEHGEACAFLFRAAASSSAGGPVTRHGVAASSVRPRSASPAVLRLRLAACGERVRTAARDHRQPRLLMSVVKCRGRAPASPLAL